MSMKTPSVKGTVCLTMIVKNEGERLIRLFKSLEGIIDYIVISDTGSTDNTIQIIRDQANLMNLPHYIDETPFKNFSFNRSHSIVVAQRESDSEFLLFLDADMRLQKGPNFDKKKFLSLPYDTMNLIQRGGELEYYNLRIARRETPDLKVVGVTHEHYSYPGTAKQFNVPKDVLWIDDIGDGGSKEGKYERDYKLLLDGLKEEPTNVRYVFYLAETCRHMGKHAEAIKYYKRRIKMGGWDEEVFMAHHGIVRANICLENGPQINKWAMKGYLFKPSRAETLYAACKWNRERSNSLMAYSFYQIGHRIPYPKNDVLFVETNVYNYGWDAEYAIFSYYLERDALVKEGNSPLKNPIGSAGCLRKIVASLGSIKSCGTRIPGHVWNNIEFNIPYYVELLPYSFKREIICRDSIYPGYLTSTPSVVTLDSQTKLYIVRNVSYRMSADLKDYIWDKDINSKYVIRLNNEEWVSLTVDCSGLPCHENLLIKGIEDMKLFYTNDNDRKNSVKVIGVTKQYATHYGRHQMVIGDLDVDNFTAKNFKAVNTTQETEKNHCPISGTTKVIHSFGKEMRFYDILDQSNFDGKFDLNFTSIVSDLLPGWFLNMRGSSCCIPYRKNISDPTPKEYWCATHNVKHGQPRRYLSTIVRINANLKQIVGFTIPFQIDETHIEFVLGITFDESSQENLIMTYSTRDASSKMIFIPVSWILQNSIIVNAVSS